MARSGDIAHDPICPAFGFWSQCPQHHPMPCLLQDWSKASAYDQPVVPPLQRRKDRVEHLREAEMGSSPGGYLAIGTEDAPRPRMSPATIAAKVLALVGEHRGGGLLRDISREERGC